MKKLIVITSVSAFTSAAQAPATTNQASNVRGGISLGVNTAFNVDCEFIFKK